MTAYNSRLKIYMMRIMVHVAAEMPEIGLGLLKDEFTSLVA